MSIALDSVSVDLAGRRVLADLSVTIEDRRVGVIGANGSGKSTLARLLNGLVLPSAGRVLVEGLDTRADTKAVRRKVGFVFQNPDNQIVYPIVSEDVAFGLKRLGLSKAQTAERVAETLARFGLAHLADASAHLLSGGEKQLLALAGMLAAEPAILVLDEPTTLLDLRNTRRIARILADLPQRIMLVTHDLDLLADFDRVLVVDGGRLVADAPPAEAIAAYRALMEAP
ncbi:energy-coupling factor ABC transporter ATP-binding protein [Salinarimonas sp.]|uniref:energy-coupling factor ABC transporter ATP-binding protein n=1 Tax=Salinarimonas sp. TaxID=2766526 RepID=UPI0032D8D7E7